MPRHDRLDLARVLLTRAIEDETLVRKHVNQQPADDPTLRNAQRARLSQLHDETPRELLEQRFDGALLIPVPVLTEVRSGHRRSDALVDRLIKAIGAEGDIYAPLTNTN
jgi:hypothetical protein